MKVGTTLCHLKSSDQFNPTPPPRLGLAQAGDTVQTHQGLAHALDLRTGRGEVSVRYRYGI
jgi:hypothetical protein